MRLIDADELIKEVNKNCKGLHPQGYYTCRKDIVDIIEQQNTAYDVDKVVEAFEKYRLNKYLTIANARNEKLYKEYEIIGKTLNFVIEIVKKGGIE